MKAPAMTATGLFALLCFFAGAGAQNVNSDGSFNVGVSCTSKASAQAISEAKDAHVEAALGARGCTWVSHKPPSKCAQSGVDCFTGSPGHALSTTEDVPSISVIVEDFGEAAASAFAKKERETTREEAIALIVGDRRDTAARPKADAAAVAEAIGTAHADAASEAINQCDACNAKANALAFAEASTFVELVSEAVSSSEAAVCTSGDSAASAEAYQTCLGDAYAKLFAAATAEALIAGECFEPEAAVEVEAMTGADFTNIEGCEGNAAAFAEGDNAAAMAANDGSGTSDTFTVG